MIVQHRRPLPEAERQELVALELRALALERGPALLVDQSGDRIDLQRGY